MHLQQTKRESLKSGGPQYYFHDLSEVVKTYLRKKGAVPVALVTPYGATKTTFSAVGAYHKLDKKRRVVPGRVGHDRIQQGTTGESIGESIRSWYCLSTDDFERIDVDIEIIDDAFYLTPAAYRQVGGRRAKPLKAAERPLTLTTHYVSSFWREQLEYVLAKEGRGLVSWALRQIASIANDHVKKVPHIQEPDILRAYGPLAQLGCSLGPYVGKGYDCRSKFQFDGYPEYDVPVEVKRHSSGFKYQMEKYGKDELSRAVILCAVHDLAKVPKNIDVIELQAVGALAKGL
ncbi:MAG TPA: hypothetical protein VMH22_10580 [bacterium]|nr:hypothetical protein [bacterium]